MKDFMLSRGINIEINDLLKRKKTDLERLDPLRQNALQKLAFFNLLTVISLLVIGWLAYSAIQPPHEMELALKICLILAGLFAQAFFYNFFHSIFTAKLRRKFKECLIENLFKLLMEDSVYEPEKVVWRPSFSESNILGKRYNVYRGEDYCKGYFNGFPLQFSEVLAINERLDTGRNTAGHYYHQKFKGLFFEVLHGNKLSSKIIARQVTNKSFPFKNLLNFETAPKEFKKVDFKSSKVKNNFRIYATNKEAVKGILNDNVFRELITFSRKYSVDVRFSVVPGKLFVGFGFKKNFFEPPLLRNLNKSREPFLVGDLFHLLQCLCQLIDLKPPAGENLLSCLKNEV